MCGISGIVAKKAENYLQPQRRMVDALHHRGPDGNGIYHFDNCVLGHNRLSIVDLATGEQPLLNNDRQVAITFNGEIYGFKNIRDNIKYPYKTTSDTEVVLALYQKYGIGMMQYLPGMFAFGIWDDKNQAFFAARDRFGEKPFYYCLTDNNELIFASEIKAIEASGLIDPEINKEAISRYLNFGYTGPRISAFKNIKVLPPAHYLLYKDNKLTVERYWDLPESKPESISLPDAAEKFEDLFTTAIKKQMVADVEVCAFLSGGLDSTSIVSKAHEINPALKTLAFGYKGDSSELPFAREAADLYKTDHYELKEEEVSISDIFRMLPEIYDEPFGDSSAIATYLICKQASKYCKVVLTGDGGDELLGGYIWWYRPVVQQLMEGKQNAAKHSFVTAMAYAEKFREVVTRNTSKRNWRDKYVRTRNNEKYATPLAFAQARSHYLSATQLTGLGLPAPELFEPSWKEDNSINDVLKYDTVDYMPGDILVKTDRAAMANSLELRSPFLDVDLASFCISLPGNVKIDEKKDKILLREAMSKYWPDSIKARSKQGFGVANKDWVHSIEMQELYNHYVHSDNSPLNKILSLKEVKKIIKDKPDIIHSLFILSIWAEKKYTSWRKF